MSLQRTWNRLASAAKGQTAVRNRPRASDDNVLFRRVVLPHLDDAFNLARWLTADRTDAEDVVQEACMRALRGIGGFSGGNARAWVLRIVRHTAYSWMRKNRPKSFELVEDWESIEAAESSAWDVEMPETAVIAKAEAALIEAAIAALPAVFRETLILREVSGLSYREIAEVTGAPAGTVMSRLARARQEVIALIGKSEKSNNDECRSPARDVSVRSERRRDVAGLWGAATAVSTGDPVKVES